MSSIAPPSSPCRDIRTFSAAIRPSFSNSLAERIGSPNSFSPSDFNCDETCAPRCSSLISSRINGVMRSDNIVSVRVITSAKALVCIAPMLKNCRTLLTNRVSNGCLMFPSVSIKNFWNAGSDIAYATNSRGSTKMPEPTNSYIDSGKVPASCISAMRCRVNSIVFCSPLNALAKSELRSNPLLSAQSAMSIFLLSAACNISCSTVILFMPWLGPPVAPRTKTKRSPVDTIRKNIPRDAAQSACAPASVI